MKEKKTNIRLVTNGRRRNYLVSEPHYTKNYFSDNLLAKNWKYQNENIHEKTSLLRSKILNIRYQHMRYFIKYILTYIDNIRYRYQFIKYQFWYDYMKRNYREKNSTVPCKYI